MTPAITRAALVGSGLSQSQLADLAAIARDAATAGCARLRQHFGQLQHIRQKGSAGNLVTEADEAAEAAVLQVLRAATPDTPVLAEESGRHQGSGDLEWCVDPLDGTTNYAHGFPFFGTAVGLTWKGLPLLGALAMPVTEQLFWAAPGLGAWCNETRIQVSACNSISEALLATGFAYDRTERRDNNYAEFVWFTHHSHGVRRAGAAVVDLAYLAAGCLDGYWERGLQPWDLAAGVALVEEAGGVVSAYDGSRFDLFSGRVLACTPGLQAEMVQALQGINPLPGADYAAPELDAGDDGPQSAAS